jgi:PAS domain S-box-containing protein
MTRSCVVGDLRMKIIKNAFWLSGARGFADVASFALFAAISRAFGPAGTGEYSYAFAIGNLVALIGCSGLEEYGIREYASVATAERSQLWRNILSSQGRQLIAAAIFLGLFLLSGINHSARASVIIESAVFFVGWYSARTLFIPAMALQSMGLPAVTDLSCRLFAILCALGLVVGLGLSLPVALIGFPAAGLAMAGIALVNSRRHAGVPRLDAPWTAVRTTLRGTVPFAATEILNQFYARADLLLIATWLSASAVGLYAIGVKFVEVGLLPLVLLGTAAYPVIGRLARGAQTALLSQATRDFVHLIALLSGWLAVGIATLLPLLIEPVFGHDFHQVIQLLFWFAVFALAKGGEVALYRLLFCFHRQSWYAISLAFGTAVIVALNVVLIPRFALRGALAAAIASTIVVDIACLYGLRRHVQLSTFTSATARVAMALGLTTLVFLATDDLGFDPRIRAVLCCLFYPIGGFLVGLVPDWRRGLLFSPRDTPEFEPAHTVAAPAGEPTAPVAVEIARRSETAVPLTLTDSPDAAAQRWWTPELLEFTNDAIIIWEMEGQGIVYWNRAAEQLYGYSRLEACGQVTHSLLRTRLAGGDAASQLETALARYGIWVGELQHTTRDGREVDVEGRLALMSQASGRWLVLEVNRDVTDRRKAEAARIAVEMQLASLRSRALILR